MTRVKRSIHARKKRRATLKLAKGYRGDASRHYRKAKEAVLKADQYSYRDRRNRKLKEIRKLRMRKRWRERSSRFVAEGEDLLAAADAAGWTALELARATASSASFRRIAIRSGALIVAPSYARAHRARPWPPSPR